MEIEVKVPPGSEKQYKSLVLENGLKVILISDPNTTDSAAAMSVRVGSSSDPLNAQGLAHLLEHMIFTGSKKYPQPHELRKFLARYGGETNAFTEMDYIMFHFNVDNVGFKGALKRFCDPFISPLFKEDCLETEIQAIEHEFEAERQTDKSRLDQLKGHTAYPGHPFNRFTWGNKKSFSLLKKDKLIELLFDIFDKSFVGCSMSLVVLGDESVSVLKKLVIDYFGRIKQGTQFNSNYIPSTSPIWKRDTLFLSKSVEDLYLLDITWVIPQISYKKMPEQFLVIALSHKCEGSLYSIFKNKGWLSSLEASFGDYNVDNDDDYTGTYACTSVGRLFSLSLELTNLGRLKVNDIVGFVYQYLQFLRDNDCPWIMEEYFFIRNLKFQCFDTYDVGSDSGVLTKQLAVNMLHIPLEDAVCADFLNQSCTKESVDELLKYFNPRTMRLDLASKSFDGNDLVEPYFNTFYKEVDISSHSISKWLNPFYEDSLFHFPPKNLFLPTVAPLSDDGDETGDEDVAVEAQSFILVDTSSLKLWHAPDEGVPTFNFCVYCNFGDDLKSQVLGIFFLHLLIDSLAPVLSQGKLANLSTSVSLSDKNKIEIKTSGFKEKFHLYISTIWNVLTCFSPSFHSFLTDKEIVADSLISKVSELFEHSTFLFLESSSASSYSIDAMVRELKLVEFDDIIHFISSLRSKLYIEGVFFGDILREEALNISKLFKTDELAPLPEDCRGDQRIRIPHAFRTRKCFSNTFDDIVRIKSDINSLAKICFQIGTKQDDPKNTGLLHLFHSLIENDVFNSLRVKKNLGYYVSCEYLLKYGIKLFCISVISSIYEPEFLLKQIREYVKGVEQFLNGVESNVFENHKKAIRAHYPDDDGEDIWEQLTEKRCFPGFNKKVRKYLKKIVKEDVITFYRKYLVESSPNIRMLSIRIWGCNSIPRG